MELPGVPTDTSAAFERRVIEGVRKMTPEARLLRTLELCNATTELAVAGIRLREPALADADVRERLGRLRYDAALVARVEEYRTRRPR